MANILVSVEKGIEVAAADVLKFLTTSQSAALKLEPGVLAALGVLLGATETAVASVSQAAATPVNITLDITTIHEIQAIWPAMKAFAESLGIKL